MNHGGARDGAGRPPTPINESRLLSLRQQGLSMAKIGERFGVSQTVIRYALRRIKREQTRQRNMPDDGGISV